MSVTKSSSRDAIAGKAKLLAWLLLSFASVVLAEKATELNDDFLEYLGNMEDSDDNWSDFDRKADTHAGRPIENTHHSSSTSSSQSSRPNVDRTGVDRPTLDGVSK